MPKVSGFGGYLVVAGSPNVIQHNSRFSFDFDYITDDVTTSGSPGCVEGLPILAKFNGGTFSTPEDSDAYPELIGLVSGAVVSIWFKRGASGIYDQVVDTIVTKYSPDNDQKKARVLTFNFEYGQLTLNVGAPAL